MTGWLPLLERHTTAFGELLAGAELEAPVLGCPGWDLRALAQHLGWTHQWATQAVVTGAPPGDPADGPDERSALCRWYAASATALVEALREAGPDGAAWTFGPPKGRAAFWQRRQVHETRLHLWDARTSQGTPDEVEPQLAWDGVLEVAEVFYPRQLRMGRLAPLRGTLVLQATDVGGELGLGEGERTVVRAPASDLLLMLWHRLPPPADAGSLLGAALTP